MKIVIKDIGGPSPGVKLVGERASLLELADTLRAKVQETPEGKDAEVPLLDSAASSGGTEWIRLEVVSDISPAMKVEQRKSLWVARGFWTFLAVIAVILILAYLGFMSLLLR
jgi:hypothetical protein